MKWLDELEKRVGEAGEELKRLRTANRNLEKKVAQLEKKLESTVSDADWEAERKGIRKRVGKLVSDLEKLVQD